MVSFELSGQTLERSSKVRRRRVGGFELGDRLVNLIQPPAKNCQQSQVVVSCRPSSPLPFGASSGDDLLSKLTDAPLPTFRLLQDLLPLGWRQPQHRSDVARRDVTERPDTRQSNDGHVDADRFVERRAAKGTIIALGETPNRVVLVAPPVAPDCGITAEELVQDQLADRQRSFDTGPAIDLLQLGDDVVEEVRLADPPCAPPRLGRLVAWRCAETID